ncbi:hypothetical protein ABZX40_25500 [Streptomyces sp. NPDC004610]|uniref:hypothetical protein n=1 Tax=unclassified Streptomyces TaxID=2593676 RepID=UPI0033B4E84A
MWARRRAARQERLERVAAEAVEEFEHSLRTTLSSADEAHQGLLELREQLAREVAETRAMLGRDDGMPAELVRVRLEAGDEALASLDEVSAQYTGIRVQVVGKGVDDRHTLVPLMEELVDFVETMPGIGEQVLGAAEAVIVLRERLTETRADLAPLRARIHPAHRAAADELAATRGTPGWHVREVALATLGDRLTALEQGRVWPAENETVTDHYRRLERDLAVLRDEIAEGGGRGAG